MGWLNFIKKIILFFISLLVSIGLISQPKSLPGLHTQTVEFSPTPVITETAFTNPSFTPFPSTTKTLIPPTPTPSPTPEPQSLRPEPGSICGFDAQAAALVADLEQSDWVHWLALLSGEEPVEMNRKTYTILTRYSEAMFTGNQNARAYEFVMDQLRQFGYKDNVDLFEQEFTPMVSESGAIWKNIVVIIPGSDPDTAHEQVLLTGHLDSVAIGQPEVLAPGADDNGSGVATLLEAARVLRDQQFRRTIKIVFFTGEEQGLFGSRSYVSHFQDEMENIVGVFNLDMFGYDDDNDHCFEIHVGWMPESNKVGGCLADVIEGYGFDLRFEYIVVDAIDASDHAPFWNAGVGAIEVLENFRTDSFENGCGENDRNPYYHTEKDLIESMNLETGHAIAKAAIAAVARMAEPHRD